MKKKNVISELKQKLYGDVKKIKISKKESDLISVSDKSVHSAKSDVTSFLLGLTFTEQA